MDSIGIKADDAYFGGEMHTLQDLSAWFFAGKGFLFHRQRNPLLICANVL